MVSTSTIFQKNRTLMWKIVVAQKGKHKSWVRFFVFLICSTRGKGRCENKAHMTICQNKRCDVCGYVVLEKKLV